MQSFYILFYIVEYRLGDAGIVSSNTIKERKNAEGKRICSCEYEGTE